MMKERDEDGLFDWILSDGHDIPFPRIWIQLMGCSDKFHLLSLMKNSLIESGHGRKRKRVQDETTTLPPTDMLVFHRFPENADTTPSIDLFLRFHLRDISANQNVNYCCICGEKLKSDDNIYDHAISKHMNVQDWVSGLLQFTCARPFSP